MNEFTHIVRPTLPEACPVALTWSRSIDWDLDDWRDVAACRDTDPDLFFPVGTTGPAIDQIESAKAVCRQCEALAPCLEFALATNQEGQLVTDMPTRWPPGFNPVRAGAHCNFCLNGG